jgi:hypothetical protein
MSEDLGEKKRAIPEVGERSPETGFSGLLRARKLERLGRKINKNKRILRRERCRGLAHRVHYQKNVDAFR